VDIPIVYVVPKGLFFWSFLGLKDFKAKPQHEALPSAPNWGDIQRLITDIM